MAHKAACYAATLSKAFFEIILFTQDSKAEDLLCGASVSSEPSLFLSNYYLSGVGFKPVQDEFQHNFAPVTAEADNTSYIMYMGL